MNHLLLSLVLCLAFGCTPAIAHDNPTWAELNSLFGKDISSDEVKNFVEAHSLPKDAKGDSGSFAPKSHAYTILFGGDRISTIVVKVSPWLKEPGKEDWKPFDGDLPSNIQRTHQRRDIIDMFGKSQTKKGDTWIVNELRIWVFFNKMSGLIDELYVSRISKEDQDRRTKRRP